MRSLAATLVLFLVAPALAAAQQTGAAPTGSAQAYYEFMLGRHLEHEGDEAGALEALKRALAADPKSAEIRAELAAFYARQNKAEESVAAAEQALAIDPNSPEAHRILGLVFAAWSDGGVAPPAGPHTRRSAPRRHRSPHEDSRHTGCRDRFKSPGDAGAFAHARQSGREGDSDTRERRLSSTVCN